MTAPPAPAPVTPDPAPAAPPFVRVGLTQFDARNFGLEGSGTVDDGPAFTAMLARVPNGSAIHIDGAPRFLFVNGIKPTKLWSVTVTTDRKPDENGATPTILYDGAPGGTVLDYDRCVSCVLRGFVIEANDLYQKRAPAGTLINLDGDRLTSGDGQTFGRDQLLEDLLFITHGPVDGLTGVAIARTATELQDHHTLRRVSGNANGGRGSRFLEQGPSYNAKGTLVDECNATGWEHGVRMANGSLHLRRFWASGNVWNLYLTGASDSCSEELSYSEGSQHHAFYAVPIEVRCGSFAAADAKPGPNGEGYIHIAGGCPTLDFLRNTFGNLPAPAAGAPTLYTLENDAARRVVILGRNMYPWTAPHGTTLAQVGLDPAHLASFPSGVVELQYERGLDDLPSGCLRYPMLPLGETGPLNASAQDWVFLPNAAMHLAPGQVSGPYLEKETVFYHGKMLVRLPDKTLASIDLGAVTKIKPTFPDLVWPNK